MISTMAKLTAYEVADPVRHWGKIHDFLVEFPAGKSRYFSVDAHVGVGVKEIWAPIESVGKVDPAHMAITMGIEIDKAMIRHLSRLEAPEKDKDEIRLHRLFHSTPDWVEIRRKKGGSLRKSSRLVRGSSLIGYDAMTSNGNRGRVFELLFDEQSLALRVLRLTIDSVGNGIYFDIDSASHCRVVPEAHSLYFDTEKIH